ncbi:MAG: hypothetical protein Q7S27_03070 [Nanoarchaeota archaeon]|nr:hypothetical protein [Nanoarchaeota archaeon]
MYRRYKFDIWDVIIWISLIVLILYILGKLTGLINTPEWVNLIPIITMVFFAGAFYQKVIAFMEKMNYRTDFLKTNLESINNKIKKSLSFTTP